MIAGLIVTGTIIQLSVPLNHDIAWVLHSSKMMVDGAEFGKDIIEPNPPLIWYMSMPVIILADLTGLSSTTVFRIVTALFATGSMVACYTILNRTSLASRKHFVQTVVFLLALFLFPLAWRDFGQREYFSLIAILPYAFMTVARLEGSKPRFLKSIFTGVIAGIGIAFKPYMMLIPICIFCYSFFKERAKILLWAEYYGMALSAIAYFLIIFLYSPAYISDVVPIVMKFYWGFNVTVWDVLYAYSHLIAALGFWALLMAVNSIKMTMFQVIILIVTGGFLFSLMAQLKGYTYHAFPAIVTALILIGSSFFILKSSFLYKGIRPQFSKACFILIFVALLFGELKNSVEWTLNSVRKDEMLQTTHREIADEVDRLAVGGTFTSFTTHPFPNFPTALNVDAKWVGRSNSHMAIPAIVKSMEQGIEIDKDVENFTFEQVLNVMQNFKPEVVMVDRRKFRHAIFESEFDFIDYYSQNSEFEKLWASYQKISSLNGIDFYKHITDTEKNCN